MTLSARYRLERGLLTALLNSPDGTTTVDAATSPEALTAAYIGGGKWVGMVIRSLADRGCIRPVCDLAGRRCVRTSTRPSRHSGHVSLWRLADRGEALRRLRAIDDRLGSLGSEPTQQTLFE